MFSSLDITLVMLLTMPISSLPIIFNVMVYLESALPLHLACKILYPKRLRISKAFGQSFLWIFIPPLTVTKPKQDWLNIVKTSRAKAKIRLALKEKQVKDGLYAKEMLERRMKNRKIEMDEGTMSHLIKKLGFKETNDFYRQIADETLDINHVIEKYQEIQAYDNNGRTQPENRP